MIKWRTLKLSLEQTTFVLPGDDVPNSVANENCCETVRNLKLGKLNLVVPTTDIMFAVIMNIGMCLTEK